MNRPAGTDRQNGSNCPIHQCTTSSRFSELTSNSVSRVLEAVKMLRWFTTAALFDDLLRPETADLAETRR